MKEILIVLLQGMLLSGIWFLLTLALQKLFLKIKRQQLVPFSGAIV